MEVLDWPEDMGELWGRLVEGWGGIGAVALKPVRGGSGVGVAKITG
jgi:hypothetical protein